MTVAEKSKYTPLTEFFNRQVTDEVTITFEMFEDEDVIGLPLPESAKVYRQWWENDESSDGRQCRAWLDAGWRVIDADLAAERVTFRRSATS